MKTEDLFKGMNLQEILKKMRISSFILAEKKYYSTHRDMIYDTTSTIADELNINDNEIGSRLALVCEYYLKGILLPAMKIVTPEKGSELERVTQNLTDIEKYKLIIGDEETITRLSNQYKISKTQMRKLVEGGSLKDLGHNLNDLAKLILDKADKGDFLEQSKYIKDSMARIIELSNSPNVKNAFPDGRYGYLEKYSADIDKLQNIVSLLRFHASYLEKGIKVQLRPKDPNIFDDERIYYFDNPTKIVVVDKRFEPKRGYVCATNGVIIPEFGIENERKTEQQTTSPFYKHFLIEDEKKIKYLQIDNNIVLNPGEIIGVMSKDGKWTTIRSINGRLEISDMARIFENLYLGDTELDKAKRVADRRLTRAVLFRNPSKLGSKYIRYVIADEKLRELRKKRAIHDITNSDSTENIEKRPTSKDFRGAYLEYTKSDLSFRFERGRQIFKNMIDILRGKGTDDREKSR